MIVTTGRTRLGDEDLLIAMANTGHGERDEFVDAASARAWWQGLVGPQTSPIAPQSLGMLTGLRDLIRRLALRNNGIETTADTAALAGLDLRLQLEGTPSLQAVAGGDLVHHICAAGVTALVRASARPGWPRFKACRGEDCRWVFVDASRNRSRRWCDMSECGNRAKSVAFRRRHRLHPGSST